MAQIQNPPNHALIKMKTISIIASIPIIGLVYYTMLIGLEWFKSVYKDHCKAFMGAQEVFPHYVPKRIRGGYKPHPKHRVIERA